MADAMMFPDTFEEFVKWFGFVDSGEHYTNGSELIQVFRVKQWLEHEFNRIEEENANYSRNNRSLTEAVTEMQKVLKKQNAEIEKLTYKFECLLCHATGSKLSKSTYSLRTMEIAVNDEVQQCCEEAKSEAIKEFADRLKATCYTYSDICGYKSTVIDINEIDNLVKEMVGDAE